jgi:hypothetical protein
MRARLESDQSICGWASNPVVHTTNTLNMPFIGSGLFSHFRGFKMFYGLKHFEMFCTIIGLYIMADNQPQKQTNNSRGPP